MSELTPGQELHRRFTLLDRLGRGGMAEVWRVHDRELDEQIAAKIVRADAGDELLTRLQQEFRAVRRLGHPNIVPVFEFHRGAEYHLITMEHVEGEDLRSLRGAAPQRVVAVLTSVAAALAHAHERGVVHRDLKASNVVLDREGRPRLLDFGIAALLDEGPDERGGGSRYNVSPQQLDGDAASPADDLYAFGVLAYELIHGAPPFWPEITAKRIRDETPAAPKSKHALPDRLGRLIATLLAKSPKDRPPDMQAVRRELERPVGEPVEAKPAVRLSPPPRARVVRPVSLPSSAPSPARPVDPPARRSGLLRLVFVACAVLVVGVGMFVVIPLLQPTPTPLAEPAEAPLPETIEPAPIDDEARREARDLLQEALPLMRSLEERGAGSWASTGIATAASLVARGHELLGSQENLAARDAYAEALDVLRELDGRTHEALEQALDSGAAALTGWDAGAAMESFGLAARIDPGNSTAERGLQRAESLDQVRRLLEEGRREEEAQRYESARESYDRAAQLDPLAGEVQSALARVQGRISSDRFAHWMSQGLAALESHDHQAARRYFEQARALRPGSAGVADGLAQVEAAETLETIAERQREATRLEADESWKAAAEAYAAVLALDATVRFAQDGESRTRERAELEDKIGFHLSNPGRLSTTDVLEDAFAVLEQARAIEPAGPKHRRQVRALEALLATAATLVAVRIESDDLTEVTVYRVGRLGTFRTRELELRPGNYTVVGSRPGYRDVRRDLVVHAGTTPETLIVRCLEKI